jgi:hypothetical protein
MMTENEVYDLACTKWKDPAVTRMGDEYVIGEWVLLSEYNEALTVFNSKSRGVRVHGRGRSWEEALVKSGVKSGVMTMEPNKKPAFDWTITPEMAHEHKVKELNAVLARKEAICPTPGCGAKKEATNPFCPTCFEEHRDAREMHATPPSKG